MKLMAFIHTLLMSILVVLSSSTLACKSAESIASRFIKTVRIDPKHDKLGELYDAHIQEDEHDFIKTLVIKTTENFAIQIDWQSLFTNSVSFKSFPLDTPAKPPSALYTLIDSASQWMVILSNVPTNGKNSIRVALYTLTAYDLLQEDGR